jgi:hypothetical protein
MQYDTAKTEIRICSFLHEGFDQVIKILCSGKYFFRTLNLRINNGSKTIL